MLQLLHAKYLSEMTLALLASTVLMVSQGFTDRQSNMNMLTAGRKEERCKFT